MIRAAAFDLPALLFRHRAHILRNGWHELRHRYAGTGVGVFWSVLSPLLQLILYTAVLTQFLPQRGRHGGAPYGLFLCTGLLPWHSFAEGLVRGSQCLVRNASLLRTWPLPLELFVAQSSVTSALGLLVVLALLAPASVLLGEPLAAPLLALPLVALLLHAFGFGVSLALASLRVLFPDLGETLRSLTQLWMWSLPVVYSESLLPGGAPLWMRLNPPYVFLQAFRGVLLDQAAVTPAQWAAMAAWVLLAVSLGTLAAARLRDEVRDLL